MEDTSQETVQATTGPTHDPAPFLQRSSGDGAKRYYRKVIHVCATDSPNVQVALLRKARGLDPGNEIILEGILPYADYRKRLETWDQVAICIGIHGHFWEGAEVLLFPPAWLNASEARALELALLGTSRRALAMGCDPGEGGANTCWSVIDRLGLLEQLSMKTPDTSVIVGHTKALIQKWGLRPDMVVFDRGGGGKQIADTLRSQGLAVRTVAFGAPVEQHHERFKVSFADRRDVLEQRYAYKNTRGEMYGTLREWIDPGRGEPPFAIPAHYRDLRAQLAPIPLIYDDEGRLVLPPKGRRGEGGSVEVVARAATRVKTLVELIGHSPDEADSLVLAIHALSQKARRPRAGVS
jgi:hypothetical protein